MTDKRQQYSGLGGEASEAISASEYSAPLPPLMRTYTESHSLGSPSGNADGSSAYGRLHESESYDQHAVDQQLLLEHLPIVRFLARRIHDRLPRHVELEDLVSAGIVGLLDAIKKFDAGKKVQFRSYAQFRIRGAILDSLRTLDWSPRDLRRKGRTIETAIRTLTARMGMAPSELDVANEIRMDLGEYQRLLGELKGLEIGTLHAERPFESGDEELNYVAGSPEEDPLFRCLQGEMKLRLTEAVEKLPERERMVMNLYYFEEMTMKEISLTLGVVESRISQIHTSAVLHMRAALTDLVSQPANNKPRLENGNKPTKARIATRHGQ